MSQKVIRNMILLASVALGAWLILQVARSQDASALRERQFSERVNLALRLAAHRLLVIEGNRRGAIAPVRQAAGNTWLVPLEQYINYDSVPAILRESFSRHGINADYYVALTGCVNGDLLLGYTASTVAAGEEVPCGSRERVKTCYNLTVTFPEREDLFQKAGLWFSSTFIILLILAYVSLSLFSLAGKKRGPEPEQPAEQPAFQFGQSIFDSINQVLTTKGQRKSLTYREAKLLQLFARHPNQLLDRERILKDVWEDEGILVGRSVDVFVSRLRKLLKEDESVRIVNVHGVGYRLEVGELS